MHDVIKQLVKRFDGFNSKSTNFHKISGFEIMENKVLQAQISKFDKRAHTLSERSLKEIE